jgi:hypothetical protein
VRQPLLQAADSGRAREEVKKVRVYQHRIVHGKIMQKKWKNVKMGKGRKFTTNQHEQKQGGIQQVRVIRG